ncbi:hypothetical protein [Flagellimonas onchidii]|uniref:hypothetical protein n=1 Tax=Flagellimonas onchidii TaxID=2562684 RepID=UPI0010A68A89|nr:hypothetical protein [Allomuricauda onchidii]
MNIFKRHTKVKHIKKFENNVVHILKKDFPNIYEVSKLIELDTISTHYSNGIPSGITLLHRYVSNVAYETAMRNHRSHFFIDGITVWNKKSNDFQQIRLRFSNNIIQGIDVENPTKFHRNFDLNKVGKESIKIEDLPIGENPDKKIAEKILKSLTKEQIELLELEYTFEIEFEEKFFYTILDMEDGNYIATDKKGKIYRLNHDHQERVKLISNNPTAFFDIYNGQKNELENIMYK